MNTFFDMSESLIKMLDEKFNVGNKGQEMKQDTKETIAITILGLIMLACYVGFFWVLPLSSGNDNPWSDLVILHCGLVLILAIIWCFETLNNAPTNKKKSKK